MPALLVAAVLSWQGTDESSPAWEARVQGLIKQLGGPSFAKRDAAMKALIAEGDRIIPLIDRARIGADLELSRRIDRIRHQLIGYIRDLSDFLDSLPANDKQPLPPIAADMAATVGANQPKSGNYLLKIIAERDHPLHRRATHLFCAAWQTGPPEHVERFLQTSFRLQAFHRLRYPHGIDAYIETRYWQQHGWIGWPRGLEWQTTTTHRIDGRPHGKPFVHKHPGGTATTGWINAGKLPLGKHTLRFEVEYEFTHKGTKRRATVRSPEFAFSVVAAAPDNDLIAPTNAALAKLVRRKLLILEIGGAPLDGWRPQIAWEEPKGKQRGLHVPEWWVAEPLPVDLCFDVALRDLTTGKSYPCDALVLKKGETARGCFTPRDARGFCKGRDGFVDVEIELQPSRSVALTHPDITGYFGWPITSPKLRAKVIGEVKEPESK